MNFNKKVFDQAKLVKEDPTGIAYTGIAYVDEDVKVLPIELDDGTIVAPTYENVCNASWPLSRQAAEICAEQNIYVLLTAAQANDARDIAGLPHEDYTLTVNGSTVDTAAKTVTIAK